MDTVKEILLKELKKLKAEEFEDFKYFLQEYGSKVKNAMSADGDKLQISPCDLENAKRRQTVDLLVQTYSNAPLQVAKDVMEKVGRHDIIESLSQTETAAGPFQYNDVIMR
ncbi:uncharacterized protein ABDE67_012200 isoform 1-T2 [Symphorus nematophorus]